MEDKPRGLLIDWGGVLTSGLPDAMRAWAEADGIDYEAYYTAMTDWLETGLVEAELNPIHALERSQIAVPDFERKLAAVLRRADGGPVPPEGLIERMFAHFEHQPQMSALVRRARTAGIRSDHDHHLPFADPDSEIMPPVCGRIKSQSSLVR